MARFGIGAMVHFVSDVADENGVTVPNWDVSVSNFNADTFVELLAISGARWIIFPFGQNTGRYCQPNKWLESRLPGACTQRPLIKDIAVACRRFGLKFVAYLPSEVCSNTPDVKNVFGWNADPTDKSLFVDRYTEFVKQWALDLGGLLDGWWFDGAYDASTMEHLPDDQRAWTFKDFDISAYFGAARAGNPESAVSFCAGAQKLNWVSDDQDYTAGEVNTLLLPDMKYPGHIQPHVLTYLDCFWMHNPGGYASNAIPCDGKIPQPRFSDEDLFLFSKEWRAHNAGVTLNLGIYRSGKIAQASLDQLARVSRFIRDIEANASSLR